MALTVSTYKLQVVRGPRPWSGLRVRLRGPGLCIWPWGGTESPCCATAMPEVWLDARVNSFEVHGLIWFSQQFGHEGGVIWQERFAESFHFHLMLKGFVNKISYLLYTIYLAYFQHTNIKRTEKYKKQRIHHQIGFWPTSRLNQHWEVLCLSTSGIPIGKVSQAAHSLHGGDFNSLEVTTMNSLSSE